PRVSRDLHSFPTRRSSDLLPQFAVTGDGAFLHLLLFGAVFCLMAFIWLALYALAVARAGDFLRRRNVRRALEGLMGIALIALGLDRKSTRLNSSHLVISYA